MQRIGLNGNWNIKTNELRAYKKSVYISLETSRNEITTKNENYKVFRRALLINKSDKRRRVKKYIVIKKIV